jgi:hypothetical protein
MLISLLLALGLAGPGAPQVSPKAASTRTSKSNAALVKEAREAYDRGEKPAFLSIYEELALRRPGEVFTLYNLACGQSLNGQSEAAVRTLEDILAHRVASNLDVDTDFTCPTTGASSRWTSPRAASLRSGCRPTFR